MPSGLRRAIVDHLFLRPRASADDIKSFSTKWLHREFIPAEILNAYVSKKTMEMNAVKTCNADKSTIFLCVMKCKTRGIQLACSDTGVVFGFRELYSAPKELR